MAIVKELNFYLVYSILNKPGVLIAVRKRKLNNGVRFTITLNRMKGPPNMWRLQKDVNGKNVEEYKGRFRKGISTSKHRICYSTLSDDGTRAFLCS